MNRLVTYALVVWLITLARVPKAQGLKELGRIRGGVLKWVLAAEPIFRGQHLDEDDYNIIVLDFGKSVRVLYDPRDLPDGVRGGGGYEVEINKKDMKILHAHYER